ncbi:beta-N-acetylhexosaminidase, partial [uncultured Duncaniella sp.]|uniref:beta-N-acetylhexosaminidase n=1 Tax=uncultured Duncaniella sp. TaxID=2768039 RepID=UPI0026F1624B
LTEVGSKRRGSEIGWSVGLNDGVPHEGFYTQDDCREVIRYAAERNITVIPEIDIPGHTTSLLACFPEIGCTGGPYSVSDHWGVHEDIVCAGNDHTFEILRDVLDEVCEVFPSEYINIGGDEAPKTRWEQCPKCQARIEKEGIIATDGHSKESALQGWFTHQIEQYLNKKGRKVIGWNEIAESVASASSAIMNRYDSVATANAVREGRDVVVNTSAYCYFDYPQGSDLRLEPKLFPLGETVGLSRVYSLEPVPAGLTEEEKSHILGVQANVWGEFIDRLLLVQYQTLPRMAAMAEVQWTEPANKNYKDFLHRLPNMRKSYDTNGYFHRAHIE